ncbi:MAG: MATE family efflux transporter [Myxococcota bacterium]|nr:MATE family efflux transporter [Myxococcota bacterium]
MALEPEAQHEDPRIAPGAPGPAVAATLEAAAEPEQRRGTGTTRQIWELAWPAILGNLLQSLVGFVDIKIVGSLGASAVAAATTGHRIFFLLQAVLMAVTAGTTALVARAWGAGDRAEAARVTRASLWLCTGAALFLTLPAMLFARDLAGIFQLDDATVELAARFILWISPFNAVFAIFLVLSTALRAAGDTRTPLWVGAVTNVVNVGLVYALVYGEFGLPALGVPGAALANGISFAVGSVVLGLLWLRGGLLIQVGRGKSLEGERVRQLIRIGTPAGLEQAVWQGGFIVFLWIVALYGTAAYAAYGIGVQILSFSFVVGFGFSIAASTMVGQHLGAEDPAGASRSGWRAMFLSIGVMLVFAAGILMAAEPIARFMIDDEEVVRLTVVFIYVLGSVQALMAIEFALGGALRGAGDTRFPLITVLSGLFGARIALAGVFAWLGLSVEWIFAALIADYCVKATMLTLRFRSKAWQHVIS